MVDDSKANTASDVELHATATPWPDTGLEQGVHALVCEPAAENVLGAQLAMTVSDVKVQGAITRWPGPAVVQAVQVGLAELELVAK
jgi:hypothetical protein